MKGSKRDVQETLSFCHNSHVWQMALECLSAIKFKLQNCKIWFQESITHRSMVYDAKHILIAWSV